MLHTLLLGHTVEVNLGQAASDGFSNGSIVWSATTSEVERRANWPRVVAASQRTACALSLSCKQILRAWHQSHTKSAGIHRIVLIMAEVAHRQMALVVASGLRVVCISGEAGKVRVPVTSHVATEWYW